VNEKHTVVASIYSKLTTEELTEFAKSAEPDHDSYTSKVSTADTENAWKKYEKDLRRLVSLFSLTPLISSPPSDILDTALSAGYSSSL
jgi:aspartokinase